MANAPPPLKLPVPESGEPMRTSLLVSSVILAACNSAPGALQVVIGPDSPTTSDDLIAEITGELVDPDGDEVSTSFTWYQDDEARPDLTELTVPASETAKGQRWKLFVLPSDGRVDGPPTEATVTILNTAPTVEVSLSPAEPSSTEDVVATITGTDLDGDEIDYHYAWLVGGVATSYQDTTLPGSATERGEVWTLEVTPSDEEATGTTASSSVNIDNTAPVVIEVSLTPTLPKVADTVLAQVKTVDEDGDEVSLSYAWSVDGEIVQEGELETLSGGLFAKHQQIMVTVTPNDGFIDGEPVASESLTVLNTAPSITGVDLVPSDIFEATEVTCTPTGWSDDDSDPAAYTYSWEVDSVAVGTESTLTGEHFDKGDNVVCTATPTDGEDSGEAHRSAVGTVQDSPPVITSATLSTTNPVEGDTIGVTVEASDDDGDAVTLAYTWQVDGLPVSSDDSLDSSMFDKHQIIYVEITPNDGGQDGAVFTSVTATVLNSPPEITSLTLSPSVLYTDDVLSTSLSTTDADGDEVTLSYAWTVDGMTISATDSSLEGAVWFDKHQRVAVEVTPNDGDDDGGGQSSSLTVLNTPPPAPDLAIEPTVPIEQEDDLVCSISSASVDPDGDSVAYTFAWTLDGVAFTGATTTTEPGDTIPRNVTDGGEVWTCTVSTHDGEEDGAAGVAEVMVAIPCDRDADGYETTECGGTDCDDDNPDLNPGEAEVCIDGLDNDCDGWVDNCSLAGADLILQGVAAGDSAGTSIDLSEDLTGDGVGDILVGAPYNESAGTDRGAAYVVSGALTGTLGLDSAVATFTGDGTYDWAGFSVSDAGDLNGDGYADIIIAAYGDSGTTGAAYVLHGPITGDRALGSADGTYVGVSTHSRPYRFARTGNDINGDGLDDILVGAHGWDHGRAYIVYGPATANGTLSLADVELYDSTSSDVGASVHWASDVDGDGLDDLLIGAPQDSTNGTWAGAAYLVLGPVSGSFDLTGADAKLLGEVEQDKAGSIVASGDLDDDGHGDVLINTHYQDGGGTDSGAVYIVYGPITGTVDLVTADSKIVGRAGDELRMAEAASRDRDGDGLSELLLGANNADESGITDCGAAYLFSGPFSGSMSTADASVTWVGVASGDNAGQVLSTGMDIDNDGLDDFLISAKSNDEAGTDAGAVYLILGF